MKKQRASMILTKFNSSTFTTEIVAKGTAKDIIDYLSKLAETNESVKPDYVKETSGVLHCDYMRFDTLIAGINAGQIAGFRIAGFRINDSGEHDGVYSIDQWVKKRENTPLISETCFDEYHPVYGRVATQDGNSRIVSFRVAGFSVSPCINYLSPNIIEMTLPLRPMAQRW